MLLHVMEVRITPIKCNNFKAPIDEIDAASLAVDPIFIDEIENAFPYGKCFKDSVESE